MNGFEEPGDSYSDKLDLKGAFTGALPNDHPLLYDLGIDLSLIKTEALLPINVLRSHTAPSLSKGSDLTGPILFLALFTSLLVLHGKIHFGYVYFISLFSCASIYTLLLFLGAQNISALICCSVLGYSMGPVLLFSMLNIALKWMGLPVQIIVGMLSAVWGAYTAGVVFREHMLLGDKLFIVIYPIFLVYLAFVLMVVF
ncbi:protein YIPF5/7 [Pancytospora epiphaga]|nr:protein YIPF5/7 [Pancytospora epiphaga]